MQTYTPSHRLSSAGFTLIELLVVMAIISILCGLGIAAYREHKHRAQFARAQLTLNTTRTALEAGEEYYGNMPFVSVDAEVDDGPLTEDTQNILPGLTLNPGIRVRVMSFHCGLGNARMEMVAAFACDAGYYTWWMKTCQGFEMSWPKTPIPGGICS